VKGDETQDPDFETHWWEGFVSSRPEASAGTDSEDRGTFSGGLQRARYKAGNARRTLFWVAVGGIPKRLPEAKPARKQWLRQV